ncbi:MAG TPA: alpha/beta hydrolase-fold protein [Thermoanaerobaculia bacterium]|nr:alpha/beta hydrolase-fold protein [Thermoanaerobaculia bacterium]
MTDLRSTLRRAFRLENRRVAVRPGRLDHIPNFESKILDNERDVVVYVPAGYDEHPGRRYPVLYMQDGQNLFEPHRSFIPGQHWRLAEAADEAIGARTAEPMIIVGIDHTGPTRIDEYTPTRDPKKNVGGRADDYARMLLEELKPVIDAAYRTVSDDTAIGGSSLGGLLALHLALKHPDVFKRAAVMSPSVWWHDRVIVREVDEFAGPDRPRIWLDIGGREGNEAFVGAQMLRYRLRAKGWSNATFRYYEDRRADHSERAWAARARKVLEFLFPPT